MSGEIDAAFFDKKFSVARYMLRYVVGASTDDVRREQLQRVTRQRAVADKEIAGVIDENYVNFNTSLARFTSISNQLEGAAHVHVLEPLSYAFSHTLVRACGAIKRRARRSSR